MTTKEGFRNKYRLELPQYRLRLTFVDDSVQRGKGTGYEFPRTRS